MAFECDFDFLSREQNEKLAAFINEMREFADNGSSEFVRVSRELKAVAKERDNYKAMLSGASKACEDLRREYKAFRDGVAAAAEDIRAAGETSANLERVRAERDDLMARLTRASAETESMRRRLKCANSEITRLREEASVREDSGASVEKMRAKYEKKIAVLEDRLRGYRDYRARVARMAAMGPDDEVLCESVLKEGGAL